MGNRRDHLRALAQRVEVDAKEVRIVGSKSVLLRTLAAVSSAKMAGFGVPSSVRSGAPDTIRTCGLHLRRVALYAAELRVHSVAYFVLTLIFLPGRIDEHRSRKSLNSYFLSSPFLHELC
jgi:hypothetical protein